jgi:TonB family protein
MVPEKFGRYDVLGLLGEGSMGRVYRGFDPLGHRNVAIKTVRPELLAADTADEYLRRFRREAQAAGALSHPSIITIYDVGESYFVMELLEGATLQSVLRTRGALRLSEALPILESVAAAIDYAHSKGIIHRDIKPGNLMILPDGRTKIMDFGVAHLVTKEMSVSGQFLGSPAYMAPERILRGDATPRSDLFSFAVVAYETVTGRKPFDGDSVSDVITCVLKGEARPPSTLNAALPPVNDEVFRRALGKDPASRFASAAAFFAALAQREAATIEPLALPPSGPALPEERVDSGTLVDTPPELQRRLAWPSPLWLGAGAAVILLVSVLAGYSLRPRTAAPELALTQDAIEAGGAPGLAVETVPSGSQVILDGVARGASPLSLANLAPGPHTVKVVRDGFAETELSLELSRGMGEVPLRLTLQPVKPDSAPLPAPRVLAAPTVAAATPAPQPSPAPEAVEPSVPFAVPTPGAVAVEAMPPPAPLPTVEPAAAASLLRAPARISGDAPRYPELARPLRLRGEVTVEMTVTEAGEPEDLRVLQSASPILEKAALEAVRTWRFEPARRNGVGVRYRGHRVTLSFRP